MDEQQFLHCVDELTPRLYRICRTMLRSEMDCQDAAEKLWKRGIAVRAGLHCAPRAHESAGTLSGGTVRISFGHDASDSQSNYFLSVMGKLS